jgi:DNA-directed RNA polymerase specialized sigma24 family protein
MRFDDYTDMGGVGEAFLTTHWSLIENIGATDNDKNRALVELLLKKYWKPVYCYLRRRGHNNEEAKDLTQGFFHEVVLNQNLIHKADQAKGRFRSFLLLALNRYLLKVKREQTTRKRMPKGGIVPLDTQAMSEIPHGITKLTPEDAFTYVWVSGLLEQVLGDVRTLYTQEGKIVYWHLFHERLVRPIMDRSNPPTLEQLCAKYDITDTAKVSNMMVTVKRRFQTLLRQKLRDLVMSEEEAKMELEEIRRFLPKLAQDDAQYR